MNDMISSGILSLDLALGGGIPYNKIIEISGPQNCSKTSVVLNLIKNNPECITAYLDIDRSINYDYLETMGIDTDYLIISQPNTTEQLLHIVSSLIANKAVDIIVIDSIATLISQEEYYEPMSFKAKYNAISEAIKQLATLIYKSDVVLVLVNQIRTQLKNNMKTYSAETTIANRAIDTYASIRLEIKQTNEIHHYDQIIGAKLCISIKKNKLSFKKKESISIKHYYETGIDTIDDLLELAVNAEIVQRNGTWYSYKDFKVQGKIAFINNLNDECLDSIYTEVMDYYFD